MQYQQMTFNVDNINNIILTSQVIEDKTAQFNASLEDKISDTKKYV